MLYPLLLCLCCRYRSSVQTNMCWSVRLNPFDNCLSSSLYFSPSREICGERERERKTSSFTDPQNLACNKSHAKVYGIQSICTIRVRCFLTASHEPNAREIASANSLTQSLVLVPFSISYALRWWWWWLCFSQEKPQKSCVHAEAFSLISVVREHLMESVDFRELHILFCCVLYATQFIWRRFLLLTSLYVLLPWTVRD